MRTHLVVILAAMHAVPSLAASTLEVELRSGFHAVGHAPVATGEKSSAYAYAVRGGSLLESRDGKRIRVSIDCAGFDHVDAAGDTTGNGNCSWSDADGDRLFMDVQTAKAGNAYTVTGGTGKWHAASGSLKTQFTYLPSPDPAVILGVEEGQGTINLQDPR